MNTKLIILLIAAVTGVASVSLFALSGETNATQAQIQPASSYQVARNRICKKRMGPYATQRRAWELVRYYRSKGYQTSGVWGSGGIYSGTRGYYFNVFYRC